MAKLFGVDVKGLVNKHIAPGLPEGLLTRKVPGVRGSKLTDPIPTTTETHKFRGIWIDYSQQSVDGTTVIQGDRKALLIGLDTVPRGEDLITIDGITLAMVRPVSTDPAGATYTVQCRDRTARPS